VATLVTVAAMGLEQKAMDFDHAVDALGIGQRRPAITCLAPQERMDPPLAKGWQFGDESLDTRDELLLRQRRAAATALQWPCISLTRDARGRRQARLPLRSQAVLRQRVRAQGRILEPVTHDFVLDGFLAEHALQPASLVLQRAILAGRNNLAAGTSCGQGSASHPPAPVKQLVGCQTVHARHTRHAIAGQESLGDHAKPIQPRFL